MPVMLPGVRWGSAPPGAPCGRAAGPAPASVGFAALAWGYEQCVPRLYLHPAFLRSVILFYALFFIRCDSVRSTPGGCFPQRSLSAPDRSFDYMRAILRNLFRRPCALLYERAGLRSVAPRVIPQNLPRRRLRRLALQVSVDFAETLRFGASVRLRRTHPCAYGRLILE